MSDKEYRLIKSRLTKLQKKWYGPAGFGWWRTDFNYSRERKPGDDDVAAETHADFKYSHASITFYMPVMATMNDEELEHTFVHELCHLPAANYPNFEDDDSSRARFERTVNDFANHMIWASKHVK